MLHNWRGLINQALPLVPDHTLTLSCIFSLTFSLHLSHPLTPLLSHIMFPLSPFPYCTQTHSMLLQGLVCKKWARLLLNSNSVCSRGFVRVVFMVVYFRSRLPRDQSSIFLMVLLMRRKSRTYNYRRLRRARICFLPLVGLEKAAWTNRLMVDSILCFFQNTDLHIRGGQIINLVVNK